MKFLALLKNELITALPWILLSLFMFIFLALPLLYLDINSQSDYGRHVNIPQGSQEFNHWALYSTSSIAWIGPSLFIFSIAMGLVLGVRHFYVPFFTKTWQFTLHRSVSRLTVISVKLTAAIIAFIIGLLIPWLILFLVSRMNGMYPVPPSVTTFFQGIVFILIGMLTYLAVALSAVSNAKWYTSKMFPLGFAFIGICMIFNSSSIAAALTMIIIFSAIMKIQLIHNFQTRQF